ncbi:DNA polymerase IV, partial [Staphylococcus capitis]
YTGQDLYNKDEFELIRLFGKRGRGLYNKARGIDHNEVKASRVRKSVGTERTFSTDVNDDDVILRKIRELSGKTAERLNKIQKSGKTVTVKIKTYQYETISKQKSLRDPIRTETDVYNIAYTLYNDLKDPEIPIRLIGVTVGSLEQSDFKNLTIYDFI